MNIVNQATEILFNEDPVGIGEVIGNPHKDEYKFEAKEIAENLSKCNTEEDLYLVSSEIFTKWFSVNDFNKNALRRAVIKIFKLKVLSKE